MTSETTSENAKHRSIGGRVMMWTVGLMIALVLYVASIGPAYVIETRTLNSRSAPSAWFVTVYRPLLTEDASYFHAWIEPYCRWWLRITDTHL